MGDLETVRRIFEGWSTGDFAAGLDDYAEDIVLVLDPEFPDAGSYEGPEGIRDGYMRPMLEAWESFRIEAESLEQQGDRILAVVRQSGVGRDSGLEVEIRYFQLWTFRDGRVTGLRSIMDESDAREALRAG